MVTFTSNQTWNLPRLFSSDVTISNGAAVTLSCKAYLPQNKKIIVEENSKLIINGGSILNVCNEPVSILVKQGGYLEITSSAVFDKCNIEVQSQGSLKLSGALTLKNSSTIKVLSGAYFCFLSIANVHLADSNTSLNIYAGYISGIHPTYFPGQSSGCISSISSLTHSGSGLIKDYSSDLYIQNETITSNQHYIGRNIYVGHHVTTTKPQGDVVITNDAHVIFDAAENVRLDAGFKCNLGSTFKIVK